MEYVSIDIETTGLNPDTDQILELAAVFENVADQRPVDQLPFFHCYVIHPHVHGNPFALAMNAEILEKIANQKGKQVFVDENVVGVNFLHPDGVWKVLRPWLGQCYMARHFGRDSRQVTLFGKNPAFDRSFCKKLPGWDESCFHYRSGDPAMLFTDFVNDLVIPDTTTCASRARVKVNGLHTALEDARRVIELIRIGSARP